MNFPKFQILPGEGNQFYFRLFEKNTKIMPRSEGYIAKTGCENGIQSVRENARIQECHQRKVASDGRYPLQSRRAQ
jgi:uncharacterized protein YegP (UPF0339 family)